MRVVIAGGHGKIALLLERRLAEAGHQASGIVRNPAHVEDVRKTGAEAAVLDLEQASLEEVTEVLSGADAVVFAAGAGPGSGAARKDTVDRAASVLLADAAERAGVRRFLQISALGAGRPPRPGSDDIWAAYIKAKGEAEQDLRNRDLDWLVLRPGGLTDEPATDRVTLREGDGVVERGTVTRDDVAAVIHLLLERPALYHRTLELVGGTTPARTAVDELG
jgi:uncharacterized protein YbjT (DUF2867 family)